MAGAGNGTADGRRPVVTACHYLPGCRRPSQPGGMQGGAAARAATGGQSDHEAVADGAWSLGQRASTARPRSHH